MTSAEICAVLRERFKQPEWSLFFEVGSGTGANCRRRVDALAMNMYPSRGLSLLGFEIKVSRSDLKRELDRPDKAEAVGSYCDEWWLAVPAGLITQDDPIPVPWGIMECKSGNLKVTKKAEHLNAKPVTREFMAAVLRSAGKVDEATIREARQQAANEAWKDHENSVKRQVELATAQFRELQAKVDAFQAATGQRLSSYTKAEKLAERIKMAEDIESLLGRWSTLNRVRQLMQTFIKDTDEVIKEEGETAS